jgi:hypothetical protein
MSLGTSRGVRSYACLKKLSVRKVRSLLQPGTRKENNYEVFHSTHPDGEQRQKTARRGSSCGTPKLSAVLAQNPAILIKTYRGFLQSAQANARLVFKIKQDNFLPFFANSLSIMPPLYAGYRAQLIQYCTTVQKVVLLVCHS